MTFTREELEGILKRSYNGLKVYELASTRMPVEATVAHADSRLVFKGVAVIDRTENSWRYGSQLMFVLWTRDKPVLENRARNDGYARVEIAVPLQAGKKLLEDALRKIWLLEE